MTYLFLIYILRMGSQSVRTQMKAIGHNCCVQLYSDPTARGIFV